jgi:hypothetical protein
MESLLLLTQMRYKKTKLVSKEEAHFYLCQEK